MMSRFRHGFVASVLGLGLSVTSGCGETPDSPPPVSPAPVSSPTNIPAASDATAVEDSLTRRATTPSDDVRSSDLQSAAAESGSRPVTVSAANKRDTAPQDVADAVAKNPEETTKPLFDGWIKPAVVLVLSGEQ